MCIIIIPNIVETLCQLVGVCLHVVELLLSRNKTKYFVLRLYDCVCAALRVLRMLKECS